MNAALTCNRDGNVEPEEVRDEGVVYVDMVAVDTGDEGERTYTQA